MAFLKFYRIVLLLACVLFSCFVADTGLSAITSRTTYAVHGATETNGRTCLVFFQEAACSGSEPVSAVIPATTFDYTTLIADQGCFTVTVTYTGNQGVTIQVVDYITFLIVSSGFAFSDLLQRGI